MMDRCYLAVDIGASSGRHMLAWKENGQIRMEEIYRFSNGMDQINGHLCWDLERLYQEVVNGMKKCSDMGRNPVSMAIDTWAVDYVLMDKDGGIVGNTYGYRDSRTKGMDEVVSRYISPQELYKRTGIQKQIFNTIYQLTAVKEQEPELLEQAQRLLLIPDYLAYRLTGNARTEYTNATTTQLVSPKTKDWDYELMERLGIPSRLFTEITMAGTPVGFLKKELADEIGLNLEVIQAGSHDTASAVAAVPAKGEDFLYISSGTWSLMGVELEEADCSEESRKANMTNEGGYEYRWRFLKNIMGLWMIQSVRHEYDDQYSFAQFCELAAEQAAFPSRVDVNDQRFLAPASMINAVKEACRETGQIVPKTCGELAAVIYRSLADSYHKAAQEIEHIAGKSYSAVEIVGGGANADYLSRLTADSTGKTVYSGPSEATAIGNLIVQMIRQGEFASLSKAREAVAASFEMKKFEPVKY